MFGGDLDAFGHNPMNDLWMYCVVTNQWTWMSGDTTANSAGNWGFLGVYSPTNTPSGRGGSVTWTDKKGHLYLFGGTGKVTNFFITYNDLWKYTIDPCCSACGSASAVAFFSTSDSAFCNGDCSTFTDSSKNTSSWQWSFPGGTPSSGTGQSPRAFVITLVAYMT